MPSSSCVALRARARSARAACSRAVALAAGMSVGRPGQHHAGVPGGVPLLPGREDALVGVGVLDVAGQVEARVAARSWPATRGRAGPSRSRPAPPARAAWPAPRRAAPRVVQARAPAAASPADPRRSGRRVALSSCIATRSASSARAATLRARVSTRPSDVCCDSPRSTSAFEAKPASNRRLTSLTCSSTARSALLDHQHLAARPDPVVVGDAGVGGDLAAGGFLFLAAPRGCCARPRSPPATGAAGSPTPARSARPMTA